MERTLQLRSESRYSTSYSLVSNDTTSEETKSKLIDTEKRLLEMKDTNERQKQEIDELKKALQKVCRHIKKKKKKTLAHVIV